MPPQFPPSLQDGAELDHRGSSQALQVPGGGASCGAAAKTKFGLGFSSQPVNSTQTSIAV